LLIDANVYLLDFALPPFNWQTSTWGIFSVHSDARFHPPPSLISEE